jgi:Protein of unknown function (DUF2786)/SprT-like family
VAERAASADYLLSAALEAALLRALGHTWEEINQNHFGGRLRRPVLALLDAQARLGQWHGERRTLSLSRRLVLDRPWGVVREVLKHEIAHQFVDEVLGIRDQTAHGPSFEATCRRFGIDASASGLPGGDLVEGEGQEPHPVLRRIAKLLALAASSNLHEAESAMTQAQRLMLKHNVDADAATASRGFGYRHLGQPLPRIDGARQVLAGILADHFFVEVIWVPCYLPRAGREGRVLEACGRAENVEVAAWVHDYLVETGERLWREHRHAQNIPGDRDRRRFLLGVMIGFSEKLQAGAADNRREGLIWKGDPDLAAYLRRRYPRRRGGGRIGYRQDATYESGRRAGRNIVLQRVVGDRGRGDGERRLLPGTGRR